MAYKSIYKCRLCGEVYRSGCTAGQKIAEICMVELCAGIVCTQPQAPRMNEPHYCGGQYAGSLGLADFQGWANEKEAPA